MRHILLAATVAAGLCMAAAGAEDKAAPGNFPADRLAKLRDPIPNLEKTPSTLKPGRADWVCQYGNLRMMTGLGKGDGEGLADDIRKFHVTFITHSLGATAISFCNRFKTLDEMRQGSLDRRGAFKIYHEQDVIALPYIDYQRCMRQPNSQTYENWDKLVAEWAPVFGPLPAKIDDVLEQGADGKPISTGGGKSFTFSAGHPFGLMRAFVCIAIDANNGGDGSYCDNHYMIARGDFNPATVAAFRAWLAANFTPAQRKDLFGAEDPAQLDPAKLGGRNATPLTVAWIRFRCEWMGMMREQMRAFGKTINPQFLMMSTYFSHAGAPFEPLIGQAIDIEQMTLGGKRDALLFWEPGTLGPSAGTGYDDARTQSEAKAKADNKPAAPFRFGRRSFSCSLKQMVGASFVPVVSKQAPAAKQNAPDALTELCMAESYANLVTPRTYKSSSYHPDAIVRMHLFQEAHPELFLGAKPCARVALWCSSQQARALRRDADAVPFSRKLMDIGLEHQVIPDRMITKEGLQSFDLLFAYEAACVTDAQLEALADFAKRGTLVAVGPLGTHDEWNRARAGGGLLSQVLKPPTEAAPSVSPDKRTVCIAAGALTKWFGDFWYRHSNDGDVSLLKSAVESSYGKAWPYLVRPALPEMVEIHLAQIPSADRLLAHVVNYNVAGDGRVTATPEFELAVKLTGPKTPTKAVLATPEMGQATKSLAMKIEDREGAKYAVVQVPAMQVYGIVAIE